MNQSHIRKRVICGAAAALLTGTMFSVFVAAKPQNYEDRAATPRVESTQVLTSGGAPSYPAAGKHA